MNIQDVPPQDLFMHVVSALQQVAQYQLHIYICVCECVCVSVKGMAPGGI